MAQCLVQDTCQSLAFDRMVRSRLYPAIVLKHDLQRLAIKIGLLLQKAAAVGEIDEDERAKDENRLGGRESCIEAGALEDEELPERMRDLLAKSHRMYVRVARLDDMMADSKVA